MKAEQLKKYIEENKDQFNLSQNNFVYKINQDQVATEKIVTSNRYKDSEYLIHKFYKAITRF
jgi:hypothetical protein